MHEKLTIKPYIIGFILSLLLTFAAYFTVVLKGQLNFTVEIVIAVILILGVAQLFVQLFFFLHMGREQKPRWNMGVFIAFAGMIILIIVSSIWIMYHLNYNMTPMEMQNSILQDENMQMPGSTPNQKSGENSY